MFKESFYQPVARGVRLMDYLRGHRRGVPIEELTENLQSSLRTTNRDLRELERAGYLIEYPTIDGHKAARLTDDNVSDVPVNRHERYGLLAMRRVIDVLHGTPLYTSVRSLCSKLTDRMTAAERREFETFGERVVFIPHGGTKIDTGKPRVLVALQDGIMNRRVVEYEYQKASGGKESGFVAPYKLVIYKNGLYVIGKRVAKKEDAAVPPAKDWEPAVLAAERFVTATFLPEAPVVPPKRLDLDEFFDGAFGILVGKRHDPMRVVIEFRKEKRAFVTNRKWHPTQRFEGGPGEPIRLIFESRNITQLVPFILEWGEYARVLEPVPLVELVATAVHEMVRFYPPPAPALAAA